MKRVETTSGPDNEARGPSSGPLDRDQARLQGALGQLSAGIIDLIAERDGLRRDVARLKAELADAEAQIRAGAENVETRLAEGKRSQELLARIAQLVRSANDSTEDDAESGDDEPPPQDPPTPPSSRIGPSSADTSFRDLLDSLLVDTPAPAASPPPPGSLGERRAQDDPPPRQKGRLNAFALAAPLVERSRARREGWIAQALAGASLGALTIAVLLVLGLTAVPRFLAYETYYVVGQSMEPTIAPGSVAVLTPVGFGQVQVGDVVTVELPNGAGTILTRVAAIEITAEGRAFVTRGDGNAAPDNWRVPAAGEGSRLLFAIPHLGYLLYALHSTTGRITLVVVPALALGSLLLVQLWRPRSAPGVRLPA